MKFFAASLLAVAATAVKLSEDEPQMAPELPKCPPKPKEMPELGELFEMIDSDGSGQIDLGEAIGALGCAVEYGVIDEDDMDGALKMFEDFAGEDGELDMSEAEVAAEVLESELSSGDELAQESGSGSDGPSGPDGPRSEGSGDELAQESGSGTEGSSCSGTEGSCDELAQEKPKKEGPKPDGSGSESGPDPEDLEGLADDLSLDSKDLPSDIDSADLEALADELEGDDLAQMSGPGPKDLPSDIDPEDLEALADEISGDDLAQESGSGSDGPSGPDRPDSGSEGSGDELAQEEGEGEKKKPKCPTKDEIEAMEGEEAVFDMIDQDKSGQIDEQEGKFALGCLVKAKILSEEEAEGVGEFIASFAGDDGKLDKDEAAAALAAAEELGEE